MNVFTDCAGSSLLCKLFSLVESKAYSLFMVHGLLTVEAYLLLSAGSRALGCSSFGTWAQSLQLLGSRAQVQYLWCMGLVALQHVKSF